MHGDGKHDDCRRIQDWMSDVTYGDMRDIGSGDISDILPDVFALRLETFQKHVY